MLTILRIDTSSRCGKNITTSMTFDIVFSHCFSTWQIHLSTQSMNHLCILKRRRRLR